MRGLRLCAKHSWNFFLCHESRCCSPAAQSMLHNMVVSSRGVYQSKEFCQFLLWTEIYNTGITEPQCKPPSSELLVQEPCVSDLHGMAKMTDGS